MNFAARSTLPERMETGCAGYEEYRRCLRDLSRVNFVTMTYRPGLSWLARASRGLNTISVLDVACGYGDMLRRIRRWSRRRKLEARLEGVDLHPWSVQAAAEATTDEDQITYHSANIFEFEPPEPFDFIISSQFAHHLTNEQIVLFIQWMERHARRGWFIGDLHRHWFPYYGFGLLGLVTGWHPIVRSDGQISIARSFVSAVWQLLLKAADVPLDAVTVTWHVPFRLCVSRLCSRP
ncbi:MAG: methyltransferase domain-containing protein [Acetobacteraceae bacterium]|nr:methyltransferase domain-containing protein [Acetobacteraceae bacterium]